MAEVKLRLTGIQGAAALAVIIVVVIVRWATIGERDDEKLRAAVRGELMNELGGLTSEALTQLEEGDYEGALAVAQQADPAKIEIHATSVSKPLLSLSSSEDVVVRIDYSLPDRTRHTKYWRFEHSLAAGWRFRRPSTAFSYYANFL